jgi:hypothetical protein
MEKEFYKFLKNHYLTENQNIESSTDLMAFILENNNCDYKKCFLDIFGILFDYVKYKPVNNDVVKLYTNDPQGFIYGKMDCFEDETYYVYDIIENDLYDKEELPFTHIILFKKSL